MGRFDARFELDSINQGVADELQERWGQTVSWYIYSPEDTAVDSIYDVASEVGGAVWSPPLRLPVVSTRRIHGPKQYEGGLYSADQITLVILVDQAEQVGLSDIVESTDAHLKDRFVYDRTVWTPMSIDVRGLVDQNYTVIGLTGRQVNPDELINDATFQSYAS